MSHTPSVRTEADGSTTVTDGLTATNVETPITVADPTGPPVLAAVVPDGEASFALIAGTYGASFIFGGNSGWTNESPPVGLHVDGTKAISVTVPSLPDGATEALIFFDNAQGGDRRFSGVAIAPGDPLTGYLPLMDAPTFLQQLFVAPVANSTGLASVLRSAFVVMGELSGEGGGDVNQDFRVGRSIVEWNADPLPVQPAITGALSAVTDPAAKDVLTSMLAMILAKGSATDGTT